jgi:hypothetical protein
MMRAAGPSNQHQHQPRFLPHTLEASCSGRQPAALGPSAPPMGPRSVELRGIVPCLPACAAKKGQLSSGRRVILAHQQKDGVPPIGPQATASGQRNLRIGSLSQVRFSTQVLEGWALLGPAWVLQAAHGEPVGACDPDPELPVCVCLHAGTILPASQGHAAGPGPFSGGSLLEGAGRCQQQQ